MDYTYAVVKASMGVMTPNKPTIRDTTIVNKIWKPFQPQVNYLTLFNHLKNKMLLNSCI